MTRHDSDLQIEVAASTRPTAAVVGAGLGGLAAAMRLGAMGYRVEIFDKLDVPGGRGSSISKNGHRFDLGPTIVTVPKVFRELWQACGRDFDEDVDLKSLDPFYQIRFPDGSHFNATGSDAGMKAEIARLSPKDLKGYEKFLKDSQDRYEFGFEDLGRRPMNSLWELIKVLPRFAWLRADRSVYAHAAKRVKDERLRMALSFHPLFIGGDPFHVTSMYILVSHLEKEFGVHYAMGGVAAIAKAMAKVVEEQNGILNYGQEVTEILTRHGRAAGIKLASGRVVSADIVVSNADAGYTYTNLLKQKKKRWSKARLGRTRWSMSLFVWYFGTSGTANKWQDVGHHTILNGPRYKGLVHDIFMKGKLANDMSLYVHRPSVNDPSVAPSGGDTFYALSPVPHLGFDNAVDWEDMRETYREKVAKVLDCDLIPGFEDHLSASMTFTPNEFRDRYLSPHGCGFSIEPRILQSAWFRPHNVSEEIPGLFLVGAGTHPGAGLPGVISSAEVLQQLVPEPSAVLK